LVHLYNVRLVGEYKCVCIAPPGNFLVVLHFEMQRLVLNPLSQSPSTTRLLKQVMQSEELAFKQLQKSEALTSLMIRPTSSLNFDPLKWYRSKISFTQKNKNYFWLPKILLLFMILDQVWIMIACENMFGKEKFISI